MSDAEGLGYRRGLSWHGDESRGRGRGADRFSKRQKEKQKASRLRKKVQSTTRLLILEKRQAALQRREQSSVVSYGTPKNCVANSLSRPCLTEITSSRLSRAGSSNAAMKLSLIYTRARATVDAPLLFSFFLPATRAFAFHRTNRDNVVFHIVPKFQLCSRNRCVDGGLSSHCFVYRSLIPRVCRAFGFERSSLVRDQTSKVIPTGIISSNCKFLSITSLTIEIPGRADPSRVSTRYGMIDTCRSAMLLHPRDKSRDWFKGLSTETNFCKLLS